MLIDFERSILDRPSFFANGGGNHIKRNAVSRPQTYRLVKRLAGANRDAARNAELFLVLLKVRRPRPIVVTVGGATRGLGSDRLWTDPQIELISVDIYDSPSVHFLADAHDMPLPESPFMQQVHEFQHDFFQVSHSAHRWLFRGFDELKSPGRWAAREPY